MLRPPLPHQERRGLGNVLGLGQPPQRAARMMRSRSARSIPPVISVSTNPGAIAFTVTPTGPTSRASDLGKSDQRGLGGGVNGKAVEAGGGDDRRRC